MQETIAKRAYRPAEVFGKLLPIGRSAGYELLRTGALRSVRVGKGYVIPAEAITEFLGAGPGRGTK